MTRTLTLLLLLIGASAWAQNVTNAIAGQQVWAGAQLTTVPTLCPDCTNIVSNAGFDSLSPPYDPWTPSGTHNLTGSTSISAPYSAVLGTGGSFTQTLTTSPGQAYNISVWINGNGDASEFQLLWGTATNIDMTTYVDGMWTNLLSTATATGSSTTIQLRSASGGLLLDDASVIHQ